MEQEYVDIDQKQFKEINEIIKNIKEKFNSNNLEREIEIRFGDKNADEKEGFKCMFPLKKYDEANDLYLNETIYSFIRDEAINYHVNKKENDTKNFVSIYFYVSGKYEDKYEFYYNQEMINELNGLKK